MSNEEYTRGVAVRRAVLGDAYVDASLSRQGAFDEPMLRFATEAYWAKVWSRDVLPRRESSIAVLAMLIASNRPGDLALHLKAAVRNGLTIGDIREVLLLSAVYCGAPAAHGAFRVAKECLAEEIKAYEEAEAHART